MSGCPVESHFFVDGIEGDAVWFDAELANERADAAEKRLGIEEATAK